MGGRLPNFLIVGAAKCGTTSLAAWLAGHPDVHVAPEKEVYFFDRESRWNRGTEWYAERFGGAGGAAAVGEATPNYLFGERALERIATTLPGVRAVACLRDPVDRAFSDWRHWYHRRAAERRPFAQAVADELEGRDAARDRGGFPGHDPDVPYYVAKGEYLPQLERLCALLGRERVHVVLLDDLHAQPGATFAEVCRFLGVDDTVAPESVGSRENASFEFRPLWLWRLLVRHRERLPEPLARFLALRVMRRPPREYAPMDAAVRARLEAHYAGPNARLAEWLGRDLSAWGVAPAVDAHAGAA